MGAWKKWKTILVYRQASHNSSKQIVNKEKRTSDTSYKSNRTNEKTKGPTVELVHKYRQHVGKYNITTPYSKWQ